MVIIYFNEYFSAIIRTVHSAVNRSPPENLQEVLLFDDGSTNGEVHFGTFQNIDQNFCHFV